MINDLHGGSTKPFLDQEYGLLEAYFIVLIAVASMVKFMVKRAVAITFTFWTACGTFWTMPLHHKIDLSGHRDRKNEEKLLKVTVFQSWKRFRGPPM